MNSKVGLAIALGLAGTASLGVSAYSYFRRRWRRKSPEEIERLRRLDLNQRGRITVGTVLELLEPTTDLPATHNFVYKYEVAGVTYEVAQDWRKRDCGFKDIAGFAWGLGIAGGLLGVIKGLDLFPEIMSKFPLF